MITRFLRLVNPLDRHFRLCYPITADTFGMTTFILQTSSGHRELVRDKALRQIQALLRENPGPAYRLPGERELAERLGVSRPSVREALRTLAQQGMLRTRHGAGTQAAGGGAALEAAFGALLAQVEPPLLDLYETRELLEVYLAGRAAERRTEAELAQIEVALRALGDGLADPIERHGPNLRFHLAIAAAAHNPVLSEILSCLYAGIHARVEAAGLEVGRWPVSREIHEQIFEAIRRQNTQDAQRAMTVHMGIAIEEIRQIEAQGL